jgi:hypothetical protein
MDDNAILDQIHQLVAEEKRLRHQTGGLTGADRTRLDTLERQLDQAWDLLRQRRAREEAGEDPDVARERRTRSRATCSSSSRGRSPVGAPNPRPGHYPLRADPAADDLRDI